MLKQDDKKHVEIDSKLPEFESKIESLTNVKATEIRNQFSLTIAHLEHKVQTAEQKIADQT